MPTITLKLELHRPTKAKQAMYEEMTRRNTAFANWLIHHPDLGKATSKIYKEFSDELLPSAIVNQTIRKVRAEKRKGCKGFKRLWCGLNNQNLGIEKSGDFYTVSFPTLEMRIGVPVKTSHGSGPWLELHRRGGGGNPGAVFQRC